MDGEKVVAAGKDLAALKRQLRPKVRATLSARATALTRTGVTSWDFGPLPKVFTDGEVKAYPALVDAGAAVDVRLFETAAAARRAMRAGTRRLVLLTVKSPANEVAKRLSTPQKLVLSDNPHGSVAALFADCVNCATDGLINDAGGPAWDADAFARLDRARPAPAARRRLRGRHLGGGDPAGRPRRPAPPRGTPQPGPRARRGRHQPPARRPHLPRLPDGGGRVPAAGRGPLPEGGRPPSRQAVGERRPGRAADGRGPPGAGRLPPRAGRLLPSGARSGEAATEIRWQIEELRVSLFAQTIGTPLPVSERRIMTSIEQLN